MPRRGWERGGCPIHDKTGWRFVKREPIRADFVPVVQREPVGGKQFANLMGIPPKDVLQNRYQNAECILAQDRPLGDSSIDLVSDTAIVCPS
jgi:hypothetical protein